MLDGIFETIIKTRSPSPFKVIYNESKRQKLTLSSSITNYNYNIRIKRSNSPLFNYKNNETDMELYRHRISKWESAKSRGANVSLCESYSGISKSTYSEIKED